MAELHDRIAYAAGIVLVMLAILLSLHEINRPFTRGHHGWSAALRTVIGQNYIDHGFFETKFTPYKHFGATTDLQSEPVHWHHPPTINVLVGASRAVFGESEAGTNAFAAFAYFAVVLAFLLTIWRRWGPLISIVSTAILLAIPLHFEWGRLLNYEPPIAALVLLAIHAAYRSRQAEGRSRLALEVGCALLLAAAGSFDWPGFILAGFVGFDSLARNPRRPRLFLLIAAVTTATLAMWVYWATWAAGGLDQVFQVAEWRSGNAHRPAELVGRQVTRLLDYLGLPVLVGMFAGATWGVVDRSDLDPVFSVFGFGSLVYFGVFQQAAWVHVFYLYFFALPASLGAGITVAGVKELATTRWTQKRGWVAAGLTGAIFMGSALALHPTTHRRSYSILAPKQPARGFPLDGRIDRIEVGRLVNRITDPDEPVVYHGSVGSLQMRATADRKFSRSNQRSLPSRAGAWVVPARYVSAARQAQLSKENRVFLIAKHLVVDTKTDQPGYATIELVERDSSLLHRYLNSSVIPPYDVVESTASAGPIREK